MAQGMSSKRKTACKNVGCGDEQQEHIFGTRHNYFTQELAAVVVTCLRPIQDRACQHFIANGGGAQEASSLPEGLLEVNNSLGW